MWTDEKASSRMTNMMGDYEKGLKELAFIYLEKERLKQKDLIAILKSLKEGAILHGNMRQTSL